jgi:hypothetical protein
MRSSLFVFGDELLWNHLVGRQQSLFAANAPCRNGRLSFAQPAE